MKKLLVLLFLLTGCNSTPSMQRNINILIIGDSISLGYTPYVKNNLSSYNVVHNQGNGQNTRNDIALSDLWLSQADHWDLITFNHGIWDASISENHVPLEEYTENLRKIAVKLKQKAKLVIFFTTTSIPVNCILVVPRSENDYNAAAVAVMHELNISVYDLNLVSRDLNEHRENPQQQNSVHFDEVGSEILAQFVTKSIETELFK